VMWPALAISAAVIACRFAWSQVVTWLIRLIDRRASQRARRGTWRERMISSWAGMRGAVSLAAALALPLATDKGRGFPDRNLIIFLTFGVIFATLVLQGLTLGPLIRVLDLDDGGIGAHEESEARIRAAEAALERLEELAAEEWVREDTAERMRGLYGFRQERFRSRHDPDGDGVAEERSQNYQRLRRELLDAERLAVTELRREGRIGDDVMRRVVRDLDLEDARLDV
jgi:monovalent cation/hydrogen antiporter